MQIVPLLAVPAQTIQTTLGEQICQLKVYQKLFGLFMDVAVEDRQDPQIISGVICLNRNLIVRSLYLGFIGDFVFMDTISNIADPTWDGLGGRYLLAYLTPEEVEAAAAARLAAALEA